MTQTLTNWKHLTHELGKLFAERADRRDKEGTFVFEHYEELKVHKFFSAAIPEELGGGGMSHSEMCDVLRTLARYCGSTALAVDAPTLDCCGRMAIQTQRRGDTDASEGRSRSTGSG